MIDYNLKIISWNIRGLGARQLQSSFTLTNNATIKLNYLASIDADIICLQECKCAYLHAIKYIVLNLLKDYHYFSINGNNYTGGLITLIKKSTFPLASSSINNDRLLTVNVKYNNNTLSIINLYAPATGPKDRINFFATCPPVDPLNSIICGDFNCNLNNSNLPEWHRINSWLDLSMFQRPTDANSSWFSSRYNNKLDFVLIPACFQRFEFKLLNTPTYLSYHVSDHKPLLSSPTKSHNIKKFDFDLSLDINITNKIKSIWESSSPISSLNDWYKLAAYFKSAIASTRLSVAEDPQAAATLQQIKIMKLAKSSLLTECPSSFFTAKLYHSAPPFVSEEQDKTKFLKFYSNLYSTKPNTTNFSKWPLINSKPRPSYNLPTPQLTRMEIYNIIKKLPRHKAAGPDKITYEVFRASPWFAARTLCPLFNAWIIHGVPEKIKEGRIILLFKGKGDRSDPANYRPITLLNTLYKIFSLLLTKKLAPWCNTVCNVSQKGFINNRQGVDNAILLQSFAQHHNNHIITLVDFKKAFDSVSHAHIQDSLNWAGLSTNWQFTINSMLGGKSFLSFYPSSKFSCNSGVRQGDPISPLLFALAIEPLNKVLNNINFRLPIPNALFYADDLALVSLKYKHMITLLKVTASFSFFSGLHINYDKTVTIFNNPPILENKFKKFNITVEKVVPTATYLGFSVGSKPNLNMTKFYDAANSLNKLLNFHSLSNRGRALLFNAYVDSTLLYQLQLATITPEQNKEFTASANKIISSNKTGHRIAIKRNPRFIGGLNTFSLSETKDIQLASIYARYYRHKKHTLYSPADLPEWMRYIKNGIVWINLYFATHKAIFKKICYHFNQKRALLGKKDSFVSFIKLQLYSFNLGEAECAKSIGSSLEICTVNLNKLLLPSKCKGFFWDFWASKLPINRTLTCPLCNSCASTNHLLKCRFIASAIHNFIQINHFTDSLHQFFTLNYIHYNHNINAAIFLFSLWKYFISSLHGNPIRITDTYVSNFSQIYALHKVLRPKLLFDLALSKIC